MLEERISEVLERYDLAHLRDAPTYSLSGGEKQLIALAGVLIAEPQYVVLDEPMTLLDLRNKRRVVQIIASLPQTVIMVSHDLEFLSAFDRALVFDQGRIAVDDVPQVAARAYIERVS
jgi:biotin transport system ATP-binding protein